MHERRREVKNRNNVCGVKEWRMYCSISRRLASRVTGGVFDDNDDDDMRRNYEDDDEGGIHYFIPLTISVVTSIFFSAKYAISLYYGP